MKKYFSLVRFAHTIFAMPFAAVGFTLGACERSAAEPFLPAGWWAVLLGKAVLCMIFARNAAMGFNRWADRRIDAENPRTAGRDIPAGRVTPREALTFVLINSGLFLLTAAWINGLAGALAPAALAVVLGYSYCKRFTSLAHVVLGLALGIAPAGAYIAATGGLTVSVCLLSLAVLGWCAGFDIIYALQDADFDRRRGLHSIPARFPVRTALGISCGLHAVSLAALAGFMATLPQGGLLWTGYGLFAAILVTEHLLVTPTRQRHIGIAFGTLNGLASLLLALFVVVHLLLCMK